MQIVKDLHLTEYEEEVDAFFAAQIADTVRKYQVETNEDPRMGTNLGDDEDSHVIQQFAQLALLWTAGQSRGEILQRMKYYQITKQFMFVTGELPVDPSVAAMFLKAAHPSRKNPRMCFKGTPRSFLSKHATLQSPPITEVRKSHLHLLFYSYFILSYILHACVHGVHVFYSILANGMGNPLLLQSIQNHDDASTCNGT